MHPAFDAFYSILSALHDSAKRALDGVTQAQLDWHPGEEMNSLAVLAAHIAGAERFWLGDIVMGELSGRNRDREFATREVGAEALSAMLDTGLETAGRIFATLAPEQLAEVRTSPRDGREYTVAWSIAHVLEHTALHVGHMEITRQLVEGNQV